MIEFSYPEKLNNDSILLGSKRHNSMNGTKAYQGKQPDKDALKNHIIGALGEYIVMEYCNYNEIKCSNIDTVVGSGIPEKDFIINGINVDVKALKENVSSFMVNKEAFDRYKNIQAYVFVRLLGVQKVEIYQFSKLQVKQWRCEDVYNQGRLIYYKKI